MSQSVQERTKDSLATRKKSADTEAKHAVKTFEALVNNPKAKQAIADACGNLLTPSRLISLGRAAMVGNSKLSSCSAGSVLGALRDCAHLGLDPYGPLQHGVLVPYKGEASFQLMYKGLVLLAARSGWHISAAPVYANDRFRWARGTTEFVEHNYDINAERGDLTGAWAVGRNEHGIVKMEVLSLSQIHEARSHSQGYKYDQTGSIWALHPGAMAQKTAVWRLAKLLPLGDVAQKAIVEDEHKDIGKARGTVIDIEQASQLDPFEGGDGGEG